jgi:hypothetical protein
VAFCLIKHKENLLFVIIIEYRMTYCLVLQNHKIEKLGKFSYTMKSKLETQVEKLHNLEEGWDEALRIEMLYYIEYFRLEHVTSNVE